MTQMSESATEPQTIENRELFVAAGIHSLVRDMSAYANNNPRFRKGLSDFVSLTLADMTATEAFEVESEEDLDDGRVEDDSQQESLVDIKFEAERKRRILWAEPYVWVEFSLTIAKTELNVELPEPIANAECSMTSEDYTREIGLVRRTEMQVYRVHGRKRQVGLMEEFDYMDSDGDSISSVTTGQDNDDQVMYVTREVESSSGDTLPEPQIEQYATLQIENRTDRTPYEFALDDAASIALVVQMDEIGQDINLMDQESTVKSARLAFENFKRAVLVQAGVIVPSPKA